MKKTLFTCLLALIAFASFAQPVMLTGGQTMPNEWIDSETGHRIIKLTRKEGVNMSFYFHNNPFVDNKMIFVGAAAKTSNDTPKGVEISNFNANNMQMFQVDLQSLEIEQITNGKQSVRSEIVCAKTKEIFYLRGDSVFSVNSVTKKTKVVYVFKTDEKRAINTVNCDGTLLAGVFSTAEEAEIFKQNPTKSQYFNAVYDAHLPRTIFIINTKNGKMEKIFTDNAWINHMQFSPSNPNLLMFCHEGPWHKVDRIWTMDVIKKTTPRLMHKRTVNMEIAGHEWFGASGKFLYFDLQKPRGATFFVGKVDLKTYTEKDFELTRDEWSVHFTTSWDEKIMAGDGGDTTSVAKAKNGKWIYLFDIEEDKLVSTKLVNMKNHNYRLEPNVHFSPDNKWIIFRANFEGAENVYAVEIDKKYDLLKADAPFPMMPVKIYNFPQRDFKIDAYGAVADGTTKNTKAIADAIAACHASGGGRVIVPAGVWFTGAVHLKSNVNLHLEKDAVLYFSDDPQDYLPAVPTSWEGLECYNYSPLLYAYQCENIAITGKGMLKAKMDLWKTWFTQTPAHLAGSKQLYEWAASDVPTENRNVATDEINMRPHLIHFNRCENVLLDGFQIRESPFWTIHIYHCDGGVARNLDVFAHGFNNDGIDLEMTRNFIVENCKFDQGDDAVVIKAGRNRDAWRLNTPTENIVVRNCTIIEGHTLLGIGSELSGGIRNIYMYNCSAEESRRFVFVKTNHRRGGFVENIFAEKLTAHKTQRVFEIDTDVLYQWRNLVPTHETRYTKIDGIYLNDIKCDSADAICEIKGDEHLPVKNIELKNISVKYVKDFYKKTTNAENVIYKNVLANNVPNILTIGDSNAAIEHGWAAQLQNLLPRANVINISQSGRTIGFDNNGNEKLNALKNIDQYFEQAQQILGDGKLDVLIICLGTNDAKKVFADRQKEVPVNFAELLDRAAAFVADGELFSPSGKPIFVTPPPMGTKNMDEKYDGGSKRLSKYVKQLTEIAIEKGFYAVDIYYSLKKVFAGYAADGVHMDAEGQKTVAELIINAAAIKN
jgi:polygalacturonase/Tol biopolymer transport system component